MGVPPPLGARANPRRARGSFRTDANGSKTTRRGPNDAPGARRAGWRPADAESDVFRSTWDGSCYRDVFDHEETPRGWGGSTRGGAHLLMGPVEAADADVHHAALARGAVHRRGALERHVRQVHNRAVGGGYPANLRPDHGETTVVTPARLSGGAGAGNAPKRARSGERGPKANHRGDVRGHLSCGESSGSLRARQSNARRRNLCPRRSSWRDSTGKLNHGREKTWLRAAFALLFQTDSLFTVREPRTDQAILRCNGPLAHRAAVTHSRWESDSKADSVQCRDRCRRIFRIFHMAPQSDFAPKFAVATAG